MLQGNGRSGNPTDLAIPAVEAPWTRLLQHQGDGKVALDQSHTRSESMGADIAREGAVCTPSKEADDVWLVSPMDYDSGFLDRATDRVERIGRPPWLRTCYVRIQNGPRIDWCRHTDSNRGPEVYKTTALPTELYRQERLRILRDSRSLGQFFAQVFVASGAWVPAGSNAHFHVWVIGSEVGLA